jgi:hypothetical protein
MPGLLLSGLQALGIEADPADKEPFARSSIRGDMCGAFSGNLCATVISARNRWKLRP